MKISDVFFVIFYGMAFVLVLYFLFGLFYKSTVTPVPSTVVVYDETPVYQDSVWWPWYGPYNYYPAWIPWGTGSYYGRRWGHRGGVRDGVHRGTMGGHVGGGRVGGGRSGGGRR
jgi:hypothetical protein